MIYSTQIEIVNGCNLKCFYCTVGDKVKIMPLELAKSLIDKASVSKTLWLQGYGEPALYPYMEELVEHARKSGKFSKLGTVTNGKKSLNYSLFDIVHFSCDSVEDTGSGKYLKLFEDKLASIDRTKVKVYFRLVNYGQDFKSLEDYCKNTGIQLIVNNLDQNSIHGDRYARKQSKVIKPTSCSFSKNYEGFGVDGSSTPCCYFREVDYGTYTDRQTLNKSIAAGNIPLSCDNCNFLIGE